MEVMDHRIALTNDGSLELFFLGCGSAFAKRNYQTNLLIVKGEDHLLVDCGTTCGRALSEAGIPLTDIRNFYISHSHADHIGGLEEVILMNRYVVRDRPHIWITPGYEKQLWAQSLRGGAAYGERHNGKDLGFRDYWVVHRPKRDTSLDREGYRFNVGSISVRTFRTRHVPEQAESWRDAAWSTGLVIDERIVYSGDTLYDDDLLPTVMPARGADAIFHDTQFFPGGVHASLGELETLPPEIRARMHLMHYGDTWEQVAPRVAQAGFAGFVQQQKVYRFAHSGGTLALSRSTQAAS